MWRVVSRRIKRTGEYQLSILNINAERSHNSVFNNAGSIASRPLLQGRVLTPRCRNRGDFLLPNIPTMSMFVSLCVAVSESMAKPVPVPTLVSLSDVHIHLQVHVHVSVSVHVHIHVHGHV
jgi:hypothetical protein